MNMKEPGLHARTANALHPFGSPAYGVSGAGCGPVVAIAGAETFEPEAICRAAIATIAGRDPKAMQVTVSPATCCS